jgi:hypothetical protein
MQFDPVALQDFAQWLAQVAAEEILKELEAEEAQERPAKSSANS